MPKTATDHIEIAEQMLADVERQAHHGAHEKVMECIRLHLEIADSIVRVLELADTIVRVEARQLSAPPETNPLMAFAQKINAKDIREKAGIMAEYLREKDNWAATKNKP